MSALCMTLRSSRIHLLRGLGAIRCASDASHSYRTHTCGSLSEAQVGERVTLCGWARRKRVLGGLEVAFVPLADATGTVQLTFEASRWREFLASLKREAVVRASGIVQQRPGKDQNKSMATGAIEVQVDSFEVLNDVMENLPILPHVDDASISETLILEERPLYLRTPQMQNILRQRSKLSMALREFLVYSHGFVEVETPTLFRATPEGAREFIVPTRTPGEFYALVQSPQQFKQLLMVGGVDRYFQIARCYRDEGSRPDRQPEFTQVDLEMSFVEADGVMGLVEEMLAATIPKIFPHLAITSPPFQRMAYSQAMQEYGTDKPDTRTDKKDSSKLNFLWITDFPLFSKDNGKWETTHHPFTAPHKDDEQLLLSKDERVLDLVRGQHYDLVVNGVEVGGGSIRIHKPELQEHIFENILNVPAQDFSHLLASLRRGCPPHGGIALGFDRLLSTLCQVSTIKDVLAFPKSSNGKDLLTGAPSNVTQETLDEYHISINNK